MRGALDLTALERMVAGKDAELIEVPCIVGVKDTLGALKLFRKGDVFNEGWGTGLNCISVGFRDEYIDKLEMRFQTQAELIYNRRMLTFMA